MFEKYKHKMECFFGLIGVLFGALIIIISAFITPDYSLLDDTVSSLGRGDAKTLFSIGFVTAGSLGIPFYIYLERTLIGHDNNLRRITTLISIFTCLCIAYIGVLPDPIYPTAFKSFHGFSAFVAFIGSSFYIVLYSFLMSRDEKYPKLLTCIGYIVGVLFVLFIIIFKPLFEWILTISILIWILIVASYTIISKGKENEY